MANSAFHGVLNPRSGKRERIAVDATVKSLTEATYTFARTETSQKKGAVGAIIQNVGVDELIYSLDGTDPSGTVGFVVQPGDFIYLATHQQVKAFKVTRKTADTSIEVLYLFD